MIVDDQTSGGLGTQPSAQTYDLEGLIPLAWSGRIRVPHFQRDFRWTTLDVVRLFDSIVKGYPVGSLLLWVRKSPAQRLLLGRLSINAPAYDEVLWVVDGQQRITSIANALHPRGHQESPFNIYYDLASRVFLPEPKQVESQHIPLPVLFDLERLIDWFMTTRPEAVSFLKEAQRVARRIRQFKVPAYLVQDADESELTEIFDRMNNYGKRLSRAEIFSALFAGPEEGHEQRLSLGTIAERVAARTGFGAIDSDTVLSAVLARRGPDPTRDPRNEFVVTTTKRVLPDFPDEDRDTAYAEGEEALVRAVEFLQSAVGVPHISLLTYRSLLVALTRFFAHFPEPQENSLRLLRRLYWRFAVSGPAVFKGSFTQVGRILCGRIRKGDEEGSVRGLLEAVSGARRALPNLERFKANEAASKVILCAWWALGPRSPITGNRYDNTDLSSLLAEQTTATPALQRIFPSGLTVAQQALPANRLFLPTSDEPVDEMARALSRLPTGIDGPAWEAVLSSHLMDRRTTELLSWGRRDEFLVARQEMIAEQASSFLEANAEWDYEDTQSLSLFNFDDADEWEDRRE